MDCFNDESVTDITFCSGSQLGKTEFGLNATAYFMDVDPSPILFVQPTIIMAEATSDERIKPMIEANESLGAKCISKGFRSSDDTKLHKKFVGGHLTLAGANSPASLASRPIRVVIQDEIDRYPKSAGKEGTPTKLADARARNFMNRKRAKFSTPTEEDASPIWRELESSDWRVYKVPCPHCDTKHELEWKDFDYSERGTVKHPVWVCPSCDEPALEHHKFAMLAGGEWVATREFNGHAGFHISSFYSPWMTWAEIVEQWIEAQGDVELLKVWTNTIQARPFGTAKKKLKWEKLAERREDYDPEVDGIPFGVLFLTAGVDVHPDRLECEVVGWGMDFESWGIDYRVFYGDTSNPRNAPWRDLKALLANTWQDERGNTFAITAANIDSSNQTTEVYQFCAPLFASRIYAIKGKDGAGNPVSWRMAKPKTKGFKPPKAVFMLGIDTIKGRTHSFLVAEDGHAGRCHFPVTYPTEWFKQVTAERKRIVWKAGKQVEVWENIRARNEAFDCRNYAYAAAFMINPVWRQLARRVGVIEEHDPDDEQPTVMKQMQKQRKRRIAPKRKRRGGYVTKYRR